MPPLPEQKSSRPGTQEVIKTSVRTVTAVKRRLQQTYASPACAHGRKRSNVTAVIVMNRTASPPRLRYTEIPRRIYASYQHARVQHANEAAKRQTNAFWQQSAQQNQIYGPSIHVLL